jgi:hypothetical protein
MPTLRTAAIASSTYTDQVLFVTPVATPIQTRTLIDKIVGGVIYVERKDIGL